MTKKFDARLTIPVFGEMEACVRLAAQDRMIPITEYLRRAIADRLANDGYLPRSE
jgi:hypothetical protein